jgi:hypothetical protein
MEKLTMKQRWMAPTPKFWKKVQSIGILLSAVGTVLATAPVSLPVVIVTAGSYAAFGGSLIAAMSQLTVDESQLEKY